ncbi:hypothetical protein [Actinomadura mexicana]|nr:hypothetical protein [Actinomadura mexicana]
MNTLDDVLLAAPLRFRRLRASPADALRACAVPPLLAAVAVAVVQNRVAGLRAKSPDGAVPEGAVPVSAVP